MLMSGQLDYMENQNRRNHTKIIGVLDNKETEMPPHKHLIIKQRVKLKES